MADISKVKIPNVATPYNIKDANAGKTIQLVQNSDGNFIQLLDEAGTNRSQIKIPNDLENFEVVQKSVGDAGVAHNDTYNESTQAIDLTKKVVTYNVPAIQLFIDKTTQKPLYEIFTAGLPSASSREYIIPVGNNTSIAASATDRFDITKLNKYFTYLWATANFFINGDQQGWVRTRTDIDDRIIRLAAANVGSSVNNSLYCVEEYRQQNNSSALVSRYVKVTNEGGSAVPYLGVSVNKKNFTYAVEGYPDSTNGQLIRMMDQNSAYIYNVSKNWNGSQLSATIKNGSNYTVKCYQYDEIHYGWLEVTGGTVTDDVYTVALSGSQTSNNYIYKIQLTDNDTQTSEEVMLSSQFNSLNL